jgi:hypothetical protein
MIRVPGVLRSLLLCRARRFSRGHAAARLQADVDDDYGAEILLRVALQPMNGSRRRAQTLRLAVATMPRLGRLVDPEIGA